MQLSIEKTENAYIVKLITDANSITDLAEANFLNKYINEYLHTNIYLKNDKGNFVWVSNANIFFDDTGKFKTKSVTIPAENVTVGEYYLEVNLTFQKDELSPWDGLPFVGRVDFTVEK